MVEFSMVLPIFMLVVMGIIEFGFAFNATLATNFASRDSALLAAEAGRAPGADCVILQSIERSISTPADRSRIQEVLIFRSDRRGQPVGSDLMRYSRSGSKTCNYPDGTSITVPYVATASGYTEDERCTYIDGCPGISSTLDTVGVRVTYQGQWHTPLDALMGMVGGGGLDSSGYTVVQTSTMRMEPVL